MFERYTEKARRVIFFARYEASQFGSLYIEPYHLLLAMLREIPGFFQPLLKSHEAFEAIRKHCEATFPRNQRISTAVDLPLSHESKQVLRQAAEESERLGHEHIRPEHMVLALLRQEVSEPTAILRRYGMELDALRREVAGLKDEGPDDLARTRRLSLLIGRLPNDRLDATARILEALQSDAVKVTVIRPNETFEISFGSP
jgi:ATP-dependent Clp protease ATP-binding subunit ClpC